MLAGNGVPVHPDIHEFIDARRNSDWATPAPIQTLTPDMVCEKSLIEDRCDRTRPRMTWEFLVETPDGTATYFMVDSYTSTGMKHPDRAPERKSAFFNGEDGHRRLRTRYQATKAAKELGIAVPHHIIGDGWIASHNAGGPASRFYGVAGSPYTRIDIDDLINDAVLMFLLGNWDVNPKHVLLQEGEYAFIDVLPIKLDAWAERPDTIEAATKSLFHPDLADIHSRESAFMARLIQYRTLSMAETLSKSRDESVHEFFTPLYDVNKQLLPEPDRDTAIGRILEERVRPFPTAFAKPDALSYVQETIFTTPELWTHARTLRDEIPVTHHAP